MKKLSDTPEKDDLMNNMDIIKPPPKSHSFTGIASTIIAIFNFTLSVAYGYFSFRGTSYELIRILESSVCCLAPVFWLAGLILAIVGLTREHENKLFPIIGFILNIIYFCLLAFTIFGLFVSM